MKIIYIANTRLPTEKAHGYQICKMCEEFSNIGLEVKLLVPTRINPVKGNVFSFYGLEKNFKINYIKSFDFLKFEKYLGRYSFYLQSLLFFIKLVFRKTDKDAVIYTRNPEIGWLFNLKGHRTIYEVHKWPGSKVRLYRFFLKKIDKIICNSKGTEKKLRNNGFFNTIVAPNGVDLKSFEIKKNVDELKKELNLPKDKNIIMYVGHLYEWKGAKIIIRAAEMLLDKKDIIFILIGGIDKDIKKYKQIIQDKKLTNIILLGHQKKEKIPRFLKCSNILLLPNVPDTKESMEYTSPIKMFEYMASKKPIIASNLPSIREILNKNNAILVEPDNSKFLVEGIKKISKNPNFFTEISAQAYKDVQQYTWDKRAKGILKHIMNKKIKICYFGVYKPDHARNKVYISGLKQNGVKVIECSDKSLGLIKYYRLFIKHWKIRNNYDVMIVGYAGHLIAPFARLISKKPVIFNAMISLSEVNIVSRKKYSKHSFKGWRIWLIDWLAFRFSNIVLVETNKQKEYLVKKFKIKPRKFVRLFTGADDSIFYPDANIKKNNKFTVLFRGRFLPEAGVRHIVKAAKILEKKEINFLIRGLGPLGKEIKAQIKSLNLKNLKLISRRLEANKLREKMLTTHVNIGQIENHERLKRTIPYKAFESLALKLPYITGNSVGIKELLEDRKNCLMVNLADPEDLAEKILELKNNPELRKKIAENGYKLYKEKLISKVLGKELLSIINEFIL